MSDKPLSPADANKRRDDALRHMLTTKPIPQKLDTPSKRSKPTRA